MRKRIGILFSLIMVLLFSLTPVFAKESQIINMIINVELNETGDAFIEEKWVIDINEGSEIYKVFENMENSKVKGLKVSDETGKQYQYIKEWDVDASRKEKANKCGIIQDDDYYELCFGIGEYGKRTYTFSYTVSDFVKEYRDNQGFNYAFFSELSFEPRHVKIVVSSPYAFNEANSEIWSFGYEGTVKFSDGKVIMETQKPVPPRGKMQLLMRIDEETFVCESYIDEKFQDIYDEAIEDSEYDEDGMSPLLGGAIIAGITGVALLIGGVVKVTQFKPCFRDGVEMSKDVEMYPEIPCHHDIFEFYYLGQQANVVVEEKSRLLTAILLKWKRNGYVSFKEHTKEGLFIDKESFLIRFEETIQFDNPLEEKLLEIMLKAAGADLQLESSEFEDWCLEHDEEIEEWFEEVDRYMEEYYRQQGILKTQEVYTRYMGVKLKKKVDVFDASIRSEMEHIAGFEKYLEDGLDISTKDIEQLEEYLIFAILLWADDDYQEKLEEHSLNMNQPLYTHMFYTSHMVHEFSKRSVHMAVGSGAGGHSSFTGGGGFSSGGGGGAR